jgi:hypothetical protein
MWHRCLASVAIVGVLSIAGCEAPADRSPPPPASGSAATAQPGPASGTKPTSPRLMPNLVGRNLQAAQDALQAAGIALFSRSHDLTGQGRKQVLDRDWKVCDETPHAGQPVPASAVPDFGVVKLTESCP